MLLRHNKQGITLTIQIKALNYIKTLTLASRLFLWLGFLIVLSAIFTKGFTHICINNEPPKGKNHDKAFLEL